MIKMSKKLEYALMALSQLQLLGASSAVVQVRALAQKLKVPFDTLSKVFQILVHANILKPMHGAHGGHRLIRSLDQIYFLEFYQLFDELPFGDKCNGPKSYCELYKTCNIVGPLTRLNNKILLMLEGLTLQDFLFEKIAENSNANS